MNPDHLSVRFADGREFGPVDMPTMAKWAREGRVPADGLLVDAQTGATRPVLSEPVLEHILQSLGLAPTPPTAPPTFVTPVTINQHDEPISVIIPYKNPHALTGYYLSVGSLIPFLGFIAGPIAIVLGIMGLRHQRHNPKLHGSAHAWVAIILGSLGTLISFGCSFGGLRAILP